MIKVCDANALEESGLGVRFEVCLGHRAATGFALRWQGKVFGYLNQCAHVAMELDWNPGNFFDSEKQFIVCATHGALYAPQSGRCAGGPCLGRGGLRPISVLEREGVIWWMPDDVVTAPPLSRAP